MIRTIAFAAALFSSTCQTTPENPDTPKEPSACERACAQMEKLGCEEAEPECEDGESGEDCDTCVEVCENAEKTGLMDLNPECRAEQSSCEAMEEACNE